MAQTARSGQPSPLMLYLALCLLFVHGALGSSSTAKECNPTNADKGTEICKEAFKESMEELKEELKEAPKRKGCCVSSSLAECIDAAYKEAECEPGDEVKKMIEDEMVEAQTKINNLANYLGTTNCGQFHRDHCGDRLLHNLDNAVQEIRALNGSPPLGTSLFASLFAAAVGAFYAQRLG